MMPTWTRAVAAVLCTLSPAPGAWAAPGGERAEYDAVVRRARAGDRTLPMAELREAAIRAGVEAGAGVKDALRKAVKAGRWKDVSRAADAVLAQNYTDLEAHYFARRAAKQLGDPAREELHHWLEIGLLQELRKTGDGRSEGTPMVVQSVDDEYFVLGMMGASLRSQTLGKCGAAPCDMMIVVGEDGAESIWYFDVHIPMERLARALGK